MFMWDVLFQWNVLCSVGSRQMVEAVTVTDTPETRTHMVDGRMTCWGVVVAAWLPSLLSLVLSSLVL
jgi:hypothetical protein